MTRMSRIKASGVRRYKLNILSGDEHLCGAARKHRDLMSSDRSSRRPPGGLQKPNAFSPGFIRAIRVIRGWFDWLVWWRLGRGRHSADRISGSAVRRFEPRLARALLDPARFVGREMLED